MSEQRWADLRFEIEHGAGQGVADDVAALLAERDQLAEALAWVIHIASAVRDDDGELRMYDAGCGCCSEYTAVPDRFVDVIRTTINAGDTGD